MFSVSVLLQSTSHLSMMNIGLDWLPDYLWCYQSYLQARLLKSNFHWAQRTCTLWTINDMIEWFFTKMTDHSHFQLPSWAQLDFSKIRGIKKHDKLYELKVQTLHFCSFPQNKYSSNSILGPYCVIWAYKVLSAFIIMDFALKKLKVTAGNKSVLWWQGKLFNTQITD